MQVAILQIATIKTNFAQYAPDEKSFLEPHRPALNGSHPSRPTIPSARPKVTPNQISTFHHVGLGKQKVPIKGQVCLLLPQTIDHHGGREVLAYNLARGHQNDSFLTTCVWDYLSWPAFLRTALPHCVRPAQLRLLASKSV